MELRPYQKEAIEHTLKAWETNPSVLLHLATGTGKTIIFSELCRILASQQKRICVVMHLQTLVGQTVTKLTSFWKEGVGIVCASFTKEKDASHLITVSSIQSLHRYLQKHPECAFDYVIVDEGHHIPPKNIPSQYGDTLTELFARNANLRLLGVTATPFRMKQGSIAGTEHSWFSDITFSYDVKEAQKDKYLCMYQHLLPEDIRHDLDKLPISNGDYQKAPLSQCMREKRHLDSILESIQKYAKGRRHIGVYTVDIEHAEAISEILNAGGVPAGCVHSKNENAPVFQAFAEGRIRALISVDMLTEGFDFPGMDCLVIASPTKSLARHLQIIGRGLRIAEGKKDCLILDLACNALYHGSARSPIFHTAEEPPVDLRICPKCATLNGVIPGVPRTYRCTHCGEMLYTPESRMARGKSSKQIATLKKMYPFLEPEDLKTILPKTNTFPCISTSYTIKRGPYGEYIELSLLLFYDQHIFGITLKLSPEGCFQDYFRFIWSQWGKGACPQSVHECIQALESGNFAVPDQISIRFDKNNNLKPAWDTRRPHLDGMAKIQVPFFMRRAAS